MIIMHYIMLNIMKDVKMSKSQSNYERITISVPNNLVKEIDTLKADFNVSKSELFKIAIGEFSKNNQRKKLESIALKMKSEYENYPELIVFSSLDSEVFCV